MGGGGEVDERELQRDWKGDGMAGERGGGEENGEEGWKWGPEEVGRGGGEERKRSKFKRKW